MDINFKVFEANHLLKLQELKSTDRKTLVVNAYAGPGAGKTTASLSITAELKKQGYLAEYVPEYAKELVYENPDILDGTEEHQFMILKEQLNRIDRLMGKVDIIVTDAPILLNQIYNKELRPEYEGMLKNLYDQYHNFNFFIQRGSDYQQEGRLHNQEESQVKDEDIKSILKKYELFFGTFTREMLDKAVAGVIKTYKRINLPLLEQEKGENHYRAQAYEKGAPEPIILFGTSKDDIMTRLKSLNALRMEGQKYNTVYIGSLDNGTNRYSDYKRYDIETGKDITPIYLEIPPSTRPGKEYIDKIKSLKENGAKYNRFKKKWYVTLQDDLNKFAEYLPVTGRPAEEEVNHKQLQNEVQYDLIVSREPYDNRISILISGENYNVYGDDYGVHFPTMSESDVKEMIERYILLDLSEKIEKMNDTIKNGINYEGKNYSIWQYAVIELALADNMTTEQMEVFTDPTLKTEVMEELRFMLKDGISIAQINQIKELCSESWQMDFMRYGVQNNIPIERLKPIVLDENYRAERDWASKRNQIDALKKEVNMERGNQDRTNPRSVNLPHGSPQKASAGKTSVLGKLSQNKNKIEADNNNAGKEPVMSVGIENRDR